MRVHQEHDRAIAASPIHHMAEDRGGIFELPCDAGLFCLDVTEEDVEAVFDSDSALFFLDDANLTDAVSSFQPRLNTENAVSNVAIHGLNPPQDVVVNSRTSSKRRRHLISD